MATRRLKRHQPYDMGYAANWKVSKLKTEIENRGMKITSVSKKCIITNF